MRLWGGGIACKERLDGCRGSLGDLEAPLFHHHQHDDLNTTGCFALIPTPYNLDSRHISRRPLQSATLQAGSRRGSIIWFMVYGSGFRVYDVGLRVDD